MMHGGDLAQAHAGIAGRGISHGGPALADQHGLQARNQRVVATVPSIIQMAVETRKQFSDRAMAFDALSARALDLATRLSGPVPAPAPTSGQRGDAAGPEIGSALDALREQVDGIRSPLALIDPALERLSIALDAIERALG